MFETNVFGLARLTQLVLPGMRRAHRGRVINIGSMGGRFTFPVGGYYHATKYAVEAISDALRNEVRRFGIDVVAHRARHHPDGLRGQRALFRRQWRRDRGGFAVCRAAGVERRQHLRRLLQPADGDRSRERGAAWSLKAIESEHPRSRYLLTPAAKAMVATRTLGGDRVWDTLVTQQFKV